MSDIKVTSLWALIGLPIGLVSLLFYLFSRRKKEEVRDKVVLITGASSGLGEACAEVFYDAGCKLILTGRQVTKLMDLKDRLLKRKKSGFHNPAIISIDLENLLSIPGKVNQAVSAFGQVDILINNAGMSYRGEASQTKIDVDMKLMNVNYFGHVEITKGMMYDQPCLKMPKLSPEGQAINFSIIPHMIKNKGGQIVTISSIQGRIAIPFRSAYAASKHALQAYFDSLRAELHQHNINVCVVSPYYINTNLSLNAITGDGSTYGKMDQNTASGQQPECVARQILDCVIHRATELTIAPLFVRMTIGLRALAPWIYFRLMEKRADREREEKKLK